MRSNEQQMKAPEMKLTDKLEEQARMLNIIDDTSSSILCKLQGIMSCTDETKSSQETSVFQLVQINMEHCRNILERLEQINSLL